MDRNQNICQIVFSSKVIDKEVVRILYNVSFVYFSMPSIGGGGGGAGLSVMGILLY